MIARLPLLLFVGAYLFSCYVGALALLFSVRFRTLFLIFSGAQPVDLSRRDLVVVLVLLHAGPLALWAGYEVAWRVAPRWRVWKGKDARPTRIVALLAFAASVAVAAWSLGRVGGVDNALQTWLDYNSYVRERWRWFAALGFGEFVNLYTLLPLSAAAVVLATQRWLVAVPCIALVLALQYPLSIRKVLLTSLILIGTAAYIYWTFGEPARKPLSVRRQRVIGLVFPTALYAVYLSLTLMTTLGPQSQAFQTMLPDSLAQAEVQRRRSARAGRESVALEFDVTDAAVAKLVEDRTSSLILYTALAPLTRTSICAIVYPVLFPRSLPYYSPDIGLDLLGWGRMPDDNLVVYRFLWPTHDWGSVAAPFHVVLYSQGGMLVALVGSLLTGAALAIAWSLVPADAQPSIAASLWGALVLTFAVFLAIDSLRNSFLVSYGMAFGIPLVVVLHACSRLSSRNDPIPTP